MVTQPRILRTLVWLISALMGLMAGCQERPTPYGPLDAQAAFILDVYYAQTYDPEASVEDLREQIRSTVYLQGLPPRLAVVEDLSIADGDRVIPVRLYRPGWRPVYPVLVFYHGGGWIRGDLDTHDTICRHLALKAGCLVVSVEYRLAPENPFPAAVEDAYAALLWVAEHAREIGGDSSRLAVAGDSSGGNLAAVMAIACRDRSYPQLRHQVLFYPVTDISCMDRASYTAFGEGYMLERGTMEHFRDCYVPGAADWDDPRASPLLADNLHGLPPATIITAHFDVLRDEGQDYAARLAGAGVPVHLGHYPGVFHGFLNFGLLLEEAAAALDEAAHELCLAFHE